MEVQKLYDIGDVEFEDITIGLIRMVKSLPDHEFFFKLNNQAQIFFHRIEDVVFHGDYYDYYFTRFEAYYKPSKTVFTFIANRSASSKQKKIQTELFSEEENIKFLLNNQPDVEYILHSSELFADFSVISLPENLVFPMQEYILSSHEELYQIIQYYE